MNEIIDKGDVEDMLGEIDRLQMSTQYLLQLYSLHDLNNGYVKYLLEDERTKIAFYCMDFEFSVFNCPTMMVYRRSVDKVKNEVRYYILLICTKYKYRNQGYASKLLDGMIERVKKENRGKGYDKAKIVLSSTQEAVLFYEAYGFRWTRESLADHKVLMMYEKYDEKTEYFILELLVDV
jgi:ribosomal protein S18 acetylase RimI-like enzyme